MSKKYVEDRPNIPSSLFELKDIQIIEDHDTLLILDRLTYAIFGFGLMPQNKQSINELEQLAYIYIQVMDIQKEWCFSPDAEKIINEAYYLVKSIVPPKVGVQKAAKLLREQLRLDPFHCGIELGLVSSVMDLSGTPFLEEGLPYYSRLGLGYHSNRCVNEEWQLLSDAFYHIALAKAEYAKMFKYKNTLPEIKTDEHLNTLTSINENVCSLCRNSIVGLYAFFESYINGIGLNYYNYHSDDLSSEEQYALQGKDRVGNHYLRIEQKLECLQRIIGHSVLYPTNNPQQLKDENIIKLLEKMKEKRDVSMHYSKMKGEIMYSPQEWMDEMMDISNLIIDVSKKIWLACYPNDTHYPYYLRELNYNTLMNITEKRIVSVD